MNSNTNDSKVENELHVRSAHENKKIYMHKYSSHVELPSLYTLNAIVYGSNPNFCVQAVTYLMPKCSTSNVPACKDAQAHICDNKNMKTQIF